MMVENLLPVLLSLLAIATYILIANFEQPYMNQKEQMPSFVKLSDHYHKISVGKRLKHIILFEPRKHMKRVLSRQGFKKKLLKTNHGACEFKIGDYGKNSNNPYNSEELWDAVIFIGRRLPIRDPPPRKGDQVFIFFEREPPTFLHSNTYRQPKWTGVFNWTLSYRQDSDIVFPYGEVFKHPVVAENKKNYSEIFRKKSKYILWFVSHCNTQSKREKYVSLLKDKLEIDIYGQCGEQADAPICETKGADCSDISASTYKFYLSFENSLCEDYVTEKTYLWFGKNMIPVVRGGAAYSELLPEGTYIDTSKFKSVNKLAKFLQKVGSSEELYTNYLKEQDKYVAVYYHLNNYFETCIKTICERLHNLDRNRKWYKSISDWWLKCDQPGDLIRNS